MQGHFNLKQTLLLLLLTQTKNTDLTGLQEILLVRTGSFVPAKGKEKQLLKIIDLYLLNLEV